MRVTSKMVVHRYHLLISYIYHLVYTASNFSSDVSLHQHAETRQVEEIHKAKITIIILFFYIVVDTDFMEKSYYAHTTYMTLYIQTRIRSLPTLQQMQL